MGRINKKGEKGSAANYVTRNRAIRKLQISLAQFRRLCIWKGVYPREPRNKHKILKSATAATTFYYRKDIQYLLHEPLLQKFRDQRVLERKITRALGRGDYSDAKRFENNAARPEKTGKPRYTLNHIVRERYPTFVDALRDLDDCLSMLFLFANLPSTTSVPAKMIARCERLCLEFQHYLIVTHSLRKSFLSIKGVYYQANIQGEDILWLVPYKFKQQVVGDIDFRIMGTFVEFYMTVLGFVNYRLYTSAGLKYPPKFDESKDEKGAELGALTVESEKVQGAIEAPNGEETRVTHPPNPEVQKRVNELIEDMRAEGGDSEATERTSQALAVVQEQTNEVLDKLEPAVPGGDILPQPSYSTTTPGQLFAHCVVFLSRETPRAPLEFILRAFGCSRIGWDAVLGEGAFTHDELDPRITHQIVDRPPVRAAVNEENGDGEDNQTMQKLGPNKRVPGRIYVQPQWVWDSINEEEVLPIDNYVPGAQLPPHLSPFVKSTPGQYDPTIPLEEQELEGEDLESDIESDPDVEEEDEEKVGSEDEVAVKEPTVELDNGMVVNLADDEDEDAEDEDGSSFSGFSEDEARAGDSDGADADENGVSERQRELEAEARGVAIEPKVIDPKAKAKAEAKKQLATKKKQEAEELERRKGMMTRKKRRLYEKMEHGHNKRNAEAEKLRAKRRKIEKALKPQT